MPNLDFAEDFLFFISAEYTKTFVIVNEKIRSFQKIFQYPRLWPQKAQKKSLYANFA